MGDDMRDYLSINGGPAAANRRANGCSRRLTEDEFDRYSRQMIVPGMGKEGQSLIPEKAELSTGR